MSEEKTNFGAALAAGTALAEPVKLVQHGKDLHVAVVPQGYKLEKLAGDSYVSAAHKTDSLNDFVAYVQRYGTKFSLVMENLPQHAVAYLDYHENVKDQVAKERPNDHTITLERVKHKDFIAWEKLLANKLVEQREFVEFIDEHEGDVFSPEGSKLPASAELLDMVEHLEGRSEVRWNSVVPKDGGNRVTYSVVDESRAGESGNVEIPREICIRLPLFKGGAAHELRIRVRVRINQGVLRFALSWLNLQDELDLEEESVRALLNGTLSKTCFVMRAQS